MTIAACYVSSEGVVLGADSTASYGTPAGMHYYNHAQKVFEIGDQATLGVVIWGLGGLGTVSHRTLIAQLGDDLIANPATAFAGVMQRWIGIFDAARTAAFAQDPGFQMALARLQALNAKQPFSPLNPGGVRRTLEEEAEFRDLRNNLTPGFCIGGHVLPDRTPSAQFVLFDPLANSPPSPGVIALNNWGFWGAPNMIQRLIFGADDETKQSILSSGMWTGDLNALNTVLSQHTLAHPIIPLRDAIDFVHACIYSTVKAMKFSHLSQICGGPIELAVISSDRRFRWVHHKQWDAAVVDGALP